jgi:tetratricopeptide (TPR) repeat protein
LYQDTGRHAAAEPLLERALAIGEGTLGPGHPELAPTLSNLAGLRSASGRYAEAEPLYRRALAVFEAGLPAGHPYLVAARAYHAHLLDRLGLGGETPEAAHARAEAVGR